MSAMHDCPCGCRSRIPYAKLACLAGWARLPLPLQRRVTATWRYRYDNPGARRDALAAALAWYRDNPPVRPI